MNNKPLRYEWNDEKTRVLQKGTLDFLFALKSLSWGMFIDCANIQLKEASGV